MRRTDLAPATIEAMLAIAGRLYDGVDRDAFLADLAEKEEVILLRDPTGCVRGYSTVLCYDDPQGQVLFSGDTGIEPEYWGTPELARTWLSVAMRHREARPSEPLWWLLLCGGPRTYRYLPLFFETFWPRHEAPTPEHAQDLLDGIASRRYGERYVDGIVRPSHPTRLRPEIRTERGHLPHVAYFYERNPGWLEGDELVCIARIDVGELTQAALKVLRTLDR